VVCASSNRQGPWEWCSGGQAVAAGERSWRVLFLIKSKVHWSNFKETHFAQNVTVTQKDKSTILKSSVHCARSYFCCSNFWLPASWDVCRKFLFLLSIPAHDEHVTRQVTVNNFEQTHTLLLPRPCYHMSGPCSWVKGVDFHRLWCTYESWFRHRTLS
jgi:hypothetical protein